MTNHERVKAYLKEIAEVSKRHGLFIESCDCCTKIRDADGKKIDACFSIEYDKETDSY